MKLHFLAGFAVASLCMTFSGCEHTKVAAKTPPAPAPTERTAPAAVSRENSRPSERNSEVATSAPARMPDAATRATIQSLLDRIQDAYFDYNKHTLRPDAESTLKNDAQTLSTIIRQYPDFKLTVEGHCDERGSEEFNLALGDARAKQTKDYLAGLGLPSDQLRTVSYGKDKPVCADHDEECWQKNRRAHLTQEQ